jgi:hypothetical protein
LTTLALGAGGAARTNRDRGVDTASGLAVLGEPFLAWALLELGMTNLKIGTCLRLLTQRLCDSQSTETISLWIESQFFGLAIRKRDKTHLRTAINGTDSLELQNTIKKDQLQNKS